MDKTHKILVVDDEENILWVFSKAFENSPYSIFTAPSAEEALEQINNEDFFLVFTDIFMPGINGLELLKKIKEHPSHPNVIIMTAQDTMNNTIEAMRHGAYDYISKPFDFKKIFELIEQLINKQKIKPVEIETPPITLEDFSVQSIIGKSESMQEIFKTIGKAAATQLPVLITGESGTGKEMVARALHHYSDRSQDSFIFINCAAIARDLLETELFGHEKGSFTGALETKKGKFELAHRGTLMLDEIGDMELALQAKILRVLQNNEFFRVGGKEPIRVDVRIIAATNQNLSDLMEKNLFREDLFHRLNVINIQLPPLRERRGDIPLLANFFLKKYSAELSGGEVFLSPEVEKIFKAYPWPGNIRELENSMKRGLVLAARGPLLMDHLPQKLQDFNVNDHSFDDSWENALEPLIEEFLNQSQNSESGKLYDQLIESVEKHLFEQLLIKYRGNQVATAKALGINRNTLKRKIDAFSIEPKKGKSKSSGSTH